MSVDEIESLIKHALPQCLSDKSMTSEVKNIIIEYIDYNIYWTSQRGFCCNHKILLKFIFESDQFYVGWDFLPQLAFILVINYEIWLISLSSSSSSTKPKKQFLTKFLPSLFINSGISFTYLPSLKLVVFVGNSAQHLDTYHIINREWKKHAINNNNYNHTSSICGYDSSIYVIGMNQSWMYDFHKKIQINLPSLNIPRSSAASTIFLNSTNQHLYLYVSGGIDKKNSRIIPGEMELLDLTSISSSFTFATAPKMKNHLPRYHHHIQIFSFLDNRFIMWINDRRAGMETYDPERGFYTHDAFVKVGGPIFIIT